MWKQEDWDLNAEGCRALVQKAEGILIRDFGICADEAHDYLYELAQARKLFIGEVAGRIIADEWVGTEVSHGVFSPGVDKWLGFW